MPSCASPSGSFCSGEMPPGAAWPQPDLPQPSPRERRKQPEEQTGHCYFLFYFPFLAFWRLCPEGKPQERECSTGG